MNTLKFFLTCCIIGALSACASLGGGDQEKGLTAFSADSLVKEKVQFTPPAPQRWELTNGLQVIFMQNDELPMVRATLYLPGGSFAVAPEEVGLAEITGSMLRSGGFEGMSAEALDKEVDDLAASLESSYSAVNGSVACGSLREDFPKVFGFLSEIVQRPAFQKDRFELLRKVAHQNISQRKDSPELIASMVLNEHVYGKGSPYAAHTTHASLDRITVERMKDFHRKYIHPKGSRLVILGDISREALNALLEKTLGKWKPLPGAIEPPPLPPVPSLAKAGVYVIERDFDQSTIVLGHIGPPLPHPDIPVMGVFNRLYGSGGFGNLLMQEIRTKLGLAYGVGGGISPGIGAGLVTVELATRNEEALRGIQKVFEVTESFLKGSVPEDELKGAKDSVERAFIFRFETPEKLLSRIAQQEILNFPPDFDAKYIPMVEAITPAGVMDIGRRWVHPEDFAIVVVGRVPASRFREVFGAKGIPVHQVKFEDEPQILD